ncbi:MAG: hypothetical protein FVQ85_15250 [Planctomycetes bacterium]|nr:hypothetical protein [Planctomycetota bacterium]
MTDRNKLAAEDRGISERVPIVIDDVKRLKTFSMSRCIYFSIECDSPSPGWTLRIRNRKIPFLLVALSGIILEPIDGGLFRTPDKLEQLFENIEKDSDEGIYVDTNDLWIPNFIFDRKNLKPGSVYRVAFKLFKAAYDFRNQILSQQEYVGQCKKYGWKARYSASETKALGLWQKKHIDETKERHEKHPELTLRRQTK